MQQARPTLATYSHAMNVSALHLCTVVECNAVRNTLVVGGGGSLGGVLSITTFPLWVS